MLSRQNLLQTAERIWVIGGGKFGTHAMESLRRKVYGADIILVDKQPIGDFPEGVESICADGIEWFVEHFTPTADISKVIPALPLHLAAEWLKKRLFLDGFAVTSPTLPDELLQRLPHPLRCSPNQAVISHADFLCPPNCPEPAGFCFSTGCPRPPSLYHLIDTLDCAPFTALSLRSRQFAAGVGGFYPSDLWKLLEKVKSLPDTPLLIGTACKCHGVIDSLYLAGQ
ncbi:potassium transporter [Desulfopila inferna]|uniref:potassium transporter n=1 Tax=Desulfopila inferna TaxID=468528 RepID=UPI001962E713|nr:potassium transporter [Desulfopila inferna]MBM9605695.1 potassium transporter [Desulfopila inferna]